jgi:hypothetical protein
VKRALGLAMVLILVVTGVVAASTFPLPGQPALLPRGNGWLVLYADRTAQTEWAHAVDVATTESEWSDLWGRVAGLTDFQPYVNFDRSIVAVFGVGTNSCTASVSFDGVVFDQQHALVHSQISDTKTCPFLDLSGAAVFAVALSRDRLPPSPFTLQLNREPVCRSCTDPPDRLIVDL